MAAAAWICLLLPLASALVITLAGTAGTRRMAAYISTLTTMGAFAAAVVVFVEMWSKSPGSRGEHDNVVDLAQRRAVPLRPDSSSSTSSRS